MFKKILLLSLVLWTVFTCTGCNMRGSTQVLDTYSPKQLLETYQAFLSGTLKLSVPRTETIPEISTSIVKSPDYHEQMASLYLYNESRYHMTIHGYAWITDADSQELSHQAIYFNSEKNVSNSTYEIRIDPNRNTYLIYELLDGTVHTPTKSSIYYIFFRYEETEYIGAASPDKDFVFWPCGQTIQK